MHRAVDISTPQARPRDAGFSLLEILVVLVIIGLMSAAVVLSMRSPETSEDKLRSALVLRLNQAVKDSVYTGRVNALSISEEDGLQLMSYVEGGWNVVQDFSDIQTVRAKLEIEDETIELPETATPLILFEPTGEMTDFKLALRANGGNITLFSAPDGSIRLESKS